MHTLAPGRRPLLAALALLALPLAACDAVARIEIDPPTVRLTGRGKTVKVHALPVQKDGRPIPKEICSWSSTAEAVATVKGAHNNAEITSTGPGEARVRCAIGGVSAEVPVTVRVVASLEVEPARIALTLRDDPAPVALTVRVYDDAREPIAGLAASVTCADENVCRGDARGQLWAVGAGETTARVAVEGAAGEVAVKVVDARSADARPQAVTGNPMEAYEKAVRMRDAAARKRKR